LRPESEDLLDQGRHIVGLECAIDHVVTSGRAIDPVTLLGSLTLSHARVLHDLVAVVLGEDTVDPDLHLSRGAFEVKVTFIDRVNFDVMRLEDFDQPLRVALVATQSVPSPDDQVSHLTGLDHGDQFAHLRAFEVLRRPPFVSQDLDSTEVAQFGEVATALGLRVR
jgi:hypothetical protein